MTKEKRETNNLCMCKVSNLLLFSFINYVTIQSKQHSEFSGAFSQLFFNFENAGWEERLGLGAMVSVFTQK